MAVEVEAMGQPHTPGPWEIGDDGPIHYKGMLRPVWNIYGGKGLGDGRLVGSAEHFPGDHYPNANARLIAAAPDLMKLATRVAALNPDAGEIGAGMLVQLVTEARAALAKAEAR